MIEGSDRVADLPQVIQRHTGLLFQLEQQQVQQGRLGSLDHGGKHGLLADVQIEEQRGLWQQGRDD